MKRKAIIVGFISIILIIGGIIIRINITSKQSDNKISQLNNNESFNEIKYYPMENADIQNSNSNLFIIDKENEKKELKVELNTEFDIEIGKETYKMKVTEINENNIELSIDKSGLAPIKESGGINLLEKYDNFSIKNGYGIELVLQAMDYNPYVYIYYSNNQI